MANRVLILGASARAAAASARRAGLTPFAIDLFADRDTCELCEYVLRVPLVDYPRGLFDAARKLPPMPWFYTGGLENYPDLVGELAAERELWGNGPNLLSQVRNPFTLSRLLSEQGLAYPEVRPGSGPRPMDGLWLKKPLWGAGGGGICPVQIDTTASIAHYYQRAIPGEPYSALCVTPEPLYSRQLTGTAWLHSCGYKFAGNIGPLDLESLDVQDPRWVIHGLATVVGLRDMFGIDFIHDGSRGSTVEVNPRYVASIEVCEFATGFSFLRHTEPHPPATCVVGKAIYYAARRLTIPDCGPWDDSVKRCTDVWRRTDFADIPRPGEVIGAGQPVVTILADAPTEAAVLATLKARAAELDRLFGVPSPPDDST